MRRQTTSQINGRAGERWFASALPSSWLLQRPGDDFGIDATVVIGSPVGVTHLEFGVQVKSRATWPRDDNFVVASVKIDAIRYWALRLQPTLLVVHEQSTNQAFFGWTTDLLNSLASEEMKGKAARLRISAGNVLGHDSWKVIEEYVTLRYNQLLSGAADRDSALARLKAVGALVGALKLLQITPRADRRSEDQLMMERLADAMAHREVVVTLNAFADSLVTHPAFASVIRQASIAYQAQCETFLHPFSELFDWPARSVALWADEDRMRDLRPQLALAISEAVTLLTGP